MFTPTIRALSVSAWLALAGALVSMPAAAQFSFNADDAGPDFGEAGVQLDFGRAVAIRNGVAFVGIPNRPSPPSGRVAVFNQTVSGWTRVQTLFAPVSGAAFGRTITFRDGIVVVGSVNAAYVYKRSNGVWFLAQTLQPPAADGVTEFPVALRYEAGTLLASAYRGSLNSLVYVFELDASGKFFRRARLKPLDSKPGDSFGRSLSMTNTTLVIGSPVGRGLHFNVPRYGGTGAAYVFKRNSLGNWAQTQKLEPADPAFGFGVSVAIDQGMIIVGAPGDDLETEFDTPDFHWAGGGAYVYLPVAGRYLETFRLRPTVEQKFAFVEFGFQVAMFGPNIAITAVAPYGFIDEFPHGFVFVYERNGSSLPLLKGIGESHLASSSLALFNNQLMIGDIGDNRCIFGCPGSVTLYNVNQLEL
jgi:hypothetical protein